MAEQKFIGNLVIIGGGNSSTIMATLGAVAGYNVTVLTRKPAEWTTDVGFLNDDLGYINQKEVRAKITAVTADPATCIPEADVIFIAGLPIHHNPTVLKQISPHLNREKEVFIGSICAYGGFNWIAAKALGPGKYHIFGTQLIPWCCGTAEYGKTGHVFGAKRMLRIATEDGTNKTGILEIMSKILQMPNVHITDFLACCFWPNNPVIHPPILYGLFKDWDGKSPYSAKGVGKEVPDFIYADMRDESVEVTRILDLEVQSIVAALSKVYPDNTHLQQNYSLQHCICENYLEQVTDPTTLKGSFTTNSAFSKHHIPYTEVEGGIVPTLAHKFFETDLPFGLCTFKDVGHMLNVSTPILDDIIRWNQRLINKDFMTAEGTITGKDAGECVVPSALGLTVDTLRNGVRG